jgi:hypothetical protein
LRRPTSAWVIGAVFALLMILVCGAFALDRGLFQDDTNTLLLVKGFPSTIEMLFRPGGDPTLRLGAIPYVFALLFPYPALPLQVIYCLAWLASGVVIFLLLREIVPGARWVAFAGGCLALCSTGDFIAGSLVSLGYDLSALFYFGALVCLFRWWNRGRPGWLVASGLLLSASVWTGYAIVTSVILTPALLWVVAGRRLTRRLIATAAVWYAVFIPYLVVFLRFLGDTTGYAAQALLPLTLTERVRRTWPLFAHNFDPWSWGPARINWFAAPPRTIPTWLTVAFVALGVGAFLLVSWRIARDAPADGGEPPRRRETIWLVGAFLFFALAANASYAGVSWAPYFYRTQTVSRYWASLALAAGASLALGNRKWRLAAATALPAIFVGLGIAGGVNRQDYFLGYWRRHRRELLSIATAAPPVQRQTYVVLKVGHHPYFLATEAEYLARDWESLIQDDPGSWSRTALWASERGTSCSVESGQMSCTGEGPQSATVFPVASTRVFSYDADENRYRETPGTSSAGGPPPASEVSSFGEGLLEPPTFLGRFLPGAETMPDPHLYRHAASSAVFQGSLDRFGDGTSAARRSPLRRGFPAQAQGWTLLDGEAPKAVAVIVDGRQVARSEDFFERPNVSAALGRRCDCGWRLAFDTGTFSVGQHLLDVEVLGHARFSRYLLARERLTVSPGEAAPPDGTASRLAPR